MEDANVAIWLEKKDKEIGDLRKQLADSQADNVKLRTALDKAMKERQALRIEDIKRCLITLAGNEKHIQDVHGCDCHGYEPRAYCADEAIQIVSDLNGALADTTPATPWISVEEPPKEDASYIAFSPSADPDKPMIAMAWYDPKFGWSGMPGPWIRAMTHWAHKPIPPLPAKETK